MKQRSTRTSGYTHAQSPDKTPCARRRWRTRCAARPCPSQTHGPRPPRRPRRPQHAVQPQSGRCAVRVPRRDDTMVKCRRCVVVSGAGVTSYDRRWCWCRHAHTFSRYAPAPNLHICLLRRHLQIMTYTVCADRRQRGQPTALLVPSVGRVGDCCCCGLLPRAQMTHVHTSSKQHSLGRVIVPMSTAPVLCRWAVQPRGALAIALSSAQRSMRRSPQSDATKPARA